MIKKILGDEDGDDQATSRRKASRPVRPLVLFLLLFSSHFAVIFFQFFPLPPALRSFLLFLRLSLLPSWFDSFDLLIPQVKKMVLHDQVFEFEFREVGLAVDADLSMDMDIQKAGDFFLFLFPLDNSDKAVAVEEIRKMYNRVSSAIMKDSIAELAIVGTKIDVAASAAAAGTERFLTEDDLKPIHESLINAIYVEVSPILFSTSAFASPDNLLHSSLC